MVELSKLYLKNVRTIPNFDVDILTELLASNLLNQTMVEGDLLLGESASRNGCPDLTTKNNEDGYEIVQCDLPDDLDLKKLATILLKNNYSYTASLHEIKCIDPNLDKYYFIVRNDLINSYGPVIKGKEPDYFLPIFQKNFMKKLSKLRNGNYRRSKTVSLVVNTLCRFKTDADIKKIANVYNECRGNEIGFDCVYILTSSKIYTLKDNELNFFKIDETTFNNCVKMTRNTLESAKKNSLLI